MRANRKLAHLWLDALATELSAAAGTLETYTDDLNCYLTWLEGQNLGLQGVDLTGWNWTRLIERLNLE
jgi:integrase/recombinase XerD